MREIPLTKGYVALVDDEDYERFGALRWRALICKGARTIYARRTVDHKDVLLHREIMGLGRDRSVEVDHINGDGLDCRRANMRVCSHAQNLCNQRNADGSLKGVRRHPNGRWYARIWVDDRDKYLGGYASETEAATAYDTAAKQFFGEFASLNFPDTGGTTIHGNNNGEKPWKNRVDLPIKTAGTPPS